MNNTIAINFQKISDVRMVQLAFKRGQLDGSPKRAAIIEQLRIVAADALARDRLRRAARDALAAAEDAKSETARVLERRTDDF